MMNRCRIYFVVLWKFIDYDLSFMNCTDRRWTFTNFCRLREFELLKDYVCSVLIWQCRASHQDIFQHENFENSVRVLQAIGGSTSATILTPAISGRLDHVNLTLDDIYRPILLALKAWRENYVGIFLLSRRCLPYCSKKSKYFC